MSLITEKIKLKNGWTAQVAHDNSSSTSCILNLSKTDLVQLFSNTDSFVRTSDVTLKDDGKTKVSVKTCLVSGREVSFVIKAVNTNSGFKKLIETLFPSKASRNLKTSVMLYNNSIPVARPVAALEQKKGIFTIQNLFITEYLQNSNNLYHFLKDKITSNSKQNLELKRHVSKQIAEILASLHKSSLWHRDAKAGNFLVFPDQNGLYKIVFIDMDGIKSYRFKQASCRLRTLAKLASTVMCHPFLNKTDYLRTFKIYCKFTGINPKVWKNIFRMIAVRAIALRLLTMVKSVDGN